MESERLPVHNDNGAIMLTHLRSKHSLFEFSLLIVFQIISYQHICSFVCMYVKALAKRTPTFSHD